MKQKKYLCLFLCCISILVGCSNKQPIVMSLEQSEDIPVKEQSQVSGQNDLEESKSEVIKSENKYQENLPQEKFCYVHICGAIKVPGVYEMTEGSRLYELIQMAGGTIDDAAVNGVNQAKTLQDGEQVYIPTISEMTEENYIMQDNMQEIDKKDDGKVNINSASLDELMTLPGIGEGKAQDIINYRDEYGKFAEIQDIMQVPGIKAGVFEKIKEQIKV